MDAFTPHAASNPPRHQSFLNGLNNCIKSGFWAEHTALLSGLRLAGDEKPPTTAASVGAILRGLFYRRPHTNSFRRRQSCERFFASPERPNARKLMPNGCDCGFLKPYELSQTLRHFTIWLGTLAGNEPALFAGRKLNFINAMLLRGKITRVVSGIPTLH